MSGHPKVGALPVGPVVGQFPASTAQDPHPRQGARADIEAGGQHDHIELVLHCSGGDPPLGDPHDRRRPGVDQLDVWQIERLVVTDLEGRPFAAVRMIRGAQELRHLWVDHSVAYPVPDVFGRSRVGCGVGHQVEVRRRENPHAFAVVLVVDPATFLGCIRQGRFRSSRVGHASQVTARLHPRPRKLGHGLLEFVIGDRPIAQRTDEIRGPLKHCQLLNLRSDGLDDLNARRASADHSDALAVQVDSTGGPLAGVQDRSAEIVLSGKIVLLGNLQTIPSR